MLTCSCCILITVLCYEHHRSMFNTVQQIYGWSLLLLLFFTFLLLSLTSGFTAAAGSQNWEFIRWNAISLIVMLSLLSSHGRFWTLHQPWGFFLFFQASLNTAAQRRDETLRRIIAKLTEQFDEYWQKWGSGTRKNGKRSCCPHWDRRSVLQNSFVSCWTWSFSFLCLKFVLMLRQTLWLDELWHQPSQMMMIPRCKDGASFGALSAQNRRVICNQSSPSRLF